MNEAELNRLLDHPEKVDGKLEYYLGKGVLATQEASENEMAGHILKAEHNPQFSQ